MCLQLASTLRLKGYWKKCTTLRVLSLVDHPEQARFEEERWAAYLRHLRIQGVAAAVCIADQLPPLDPATMAFPDGGGGAGGGASGLFTADEDEAPSPLSNPALTAYSPFFAALSQEQRAAVVRAKMLQVSAAGTTALSLVPLCPSPAGADLDCDYLSELSALTEDLPVVMVHAKTNVIYTDL